MNNEFKNNIEWWFLFSIRIIMALSGIALFISDKILHLIIPPIAEIYYLAFALVAIYGDKVAYAYSKIKNIMNVIDKMDDKENENNNEDFYN